MFRISPSKAKMYARCPAQYRYEYVDRRTSLKKPKPYLTLGEHVHNTLRDFFRFEPGKRSAETLKALFQAHWRLKHGPEAGFSSGEQEERYKARALAMLEGFLAGQDTGARPLLTEDFYEMPLEYGIVLVGRLDRADPLPDGSVRVLDYKTGRYSERFSKEDDPQLMAYALLAQHKLGKKVSQAAFLYLAENRTVETSPEPAALELARKGFVSASRTILAAHQTRNLPAKPNPLCPWCSYLEICPEAQEDGFKPAPLEEETEDW